MHYDSVETYFVVELREEKHFVLLLIIVQVLTNEMARVRDCCHSVDLELKPELANAVEKIALFAALA